MTWQLDSQGEIVPIESRRNTDIEGEDERIRSRQHLIFAASARYCRLYLTNKDWMLW